MAAASGSTVPALALEGEGTYTFEWSGQGEDIVVTGTFAQWGHRYRLERGDDGVFRVDLQLPPGPHEYKFVVDGSWKYDPSKPFRMDYFGNINNFVVIGPTGREVEVGARAAGHVETPGFRMRRSASLPGNSSGSVHTAAGQEGQVGQLGLRVVDDTWDPKAVTPSLAGDEASVSGADLDEAASRASDEESVIRTTATSGFGADLLTPQRRRQLSLQSNVGPATIRRDGKLVIVMVGLPARGKTYIARKLARHLHWMGHRVQIFNVGNYRRERVGAKMAHDFFNPKNESGRRARKQLAQAAMDDMISALNEGLDIAIYDATNTTKERREWVRASIHEHIPKAHTIFLESVCTDSDLIRSNVRETKLSSPDYIGVAVDDAVRDFLQRIEHYVAVYETLEEAENSCYIKLINVNQQIIANRIGGYFDSQILFFLSNIHIRPRPIWLSRHGESCFNTEDRIGGDSALSPLGVAYADALSSFINRHYPEDSELMVWTSTLHRTTQTASKLNRPSIRWRQLDEIDAGVCDGMSYEEVAKQMPQEWRARKADKFNYRYPRGESYQDLVHRLEPVVIELMRVRAPLLIIAHQAVLRVIYAYLMDKSPEECPYLPMPLHTVIQLTPKAYSCEEVWHRLGPRQAGGNSH